MYPRTVMTSPEQTFAPARVPLPFMNTTLDRPNLPQVSPVEELTDAAERVRGSTAAYLRWRFGGWSIS